MFRAIAFVCVAAILCGSVDSVVVGGNGKTDAKRNFEVTMKSNKFDQKEIVIKVGDTVRWINEDEAKHSVTNDGGDLTMTEIIVDGQTFSKRISFDKEGMFKYKCKFHGGMTGMVTVVK